MCAPNVMIIVVETVNDKPHGGAREEQITEGWFIFWGPSTSAQNLMTVHPEVGEVFQSGSTEPTLSSTDQCGRQAKLQYVRSTSFLSADMLVTPSQQTNLHYSLNNLMWCHWANWANTVTKASGLIIKLFLHHSLLMLSLAGAVSSLLLGQKCNSKPKLWAVKTSNNKH